ncbi:FHA domain-containing protein [Haliangium sp. UPWRP_2]|nr:FHA domain-containing protein [Haliangium sp. UPWRP_2]
MDAGEFTIGRDQDRQLVLASPSVSRRHCRVRVEPTGVSIIDDGSANGIVINGGRIPANTMTAIPPGTRVEIAEFRLLIEQVGMAPAPMAPPPDGGAPDGGSADDAAADAGNDAAAAPAADAVGGHSRRRDATKRDAWRGWPHRSGPPDCRGRTVQRSRLRSAWSARDHGGSRRR